MSIIIFAIVVLIIVALLCYAAGMIPLQPPFGVIIQILIVIVGVLAIGQRAGIF